ncbi:response regulator transcription factor [Magnetospirillum sp. 15-1]|uniref:response regulator n=1 Tax=Magnetospirillum sp. 15-1 TaxID=1979370 RepID=UPI000BBB6F76|nr:response regulator transcription factor [Magnetospirillum sp. 15-1]
MITVLVAVMNGDRAAVRTVLVDDHGIVRTAIRRALEGMAWIDVVGEADDGVAAIRLIADAKPDLIILDLSMPGLDGMDIIPLVKRRSPTSRIVVLTGTQDGATMKRAFALGADAYTLKAGGWQDLEMAIAEVVAGRRYVSPSARLVLDMGEEGPASAVGAVAPLSGRERQVLKLLAEGYTNQKVAGILGISVKTVDRHRENIMNKLGVRTPVALAAIALREGLVV